MATEQVQKVLRVTMANTTPSEMRVERTHIWTGPSISFPGTIPAHGAPTVVHYKDKVSKAAAIYVGRNAAGLACSWLLAWTAPPPVIAAQNRVFVICGSKEKIDQLSFDEIHNLLDNSKTKAEFADLLTKTCADVEIDRLVSDSTTVVSTFALLP